MSYSSAPRAHQIDVVDQVGRAYRAVLDHAQLVGEMALLPYLAVVAIVIVEHLVFGATLGFVAAGSMGAGLIGFALSAIVALIVPMVMMLVFSVFVVRWHRFVLLGEAVSGGLMPPGWPEFVVTAVKVGIALFVGWLILMVIALLPPHFLTLPLAGLGGVALTLAALRVSLVFPAAAIGRPLPLRTAWDLLAGNFWRLFAAAFACYFPFLVVQMLIHGIGSWFPSVLAVVFEVARLAAAFGGAAVVSALLSHLYRDIAPNTP
jgi:hypothetical protein